MRHAAGSLRFPVSMLFLALPAPLAAQQPDLAPYADSVFAEWNSTRTPGCAVGVEREGKVLLTRGYGMADLESGRPITPASGKFSSKPPRMTAIENQPRDL